MGGVGGREASASRGLTRRGHQNCPSGSLCHDKGSPALLNHRSQAPGCASGVWGMSRISGIVHPFQPQGVFVTVDAALHPTAYLGWEGVNATPGAAPRELMSRGCCHLSCLHCLQPVASAFTVQRVAAGKTFLFHASLLSTVIGNRCTNP